MERFKSMLSFLFDIGMYANIAALLPQPITMWWKGTSDGVSLWTWLLFFIFQAAISLHGRLNLNSTSMFLGMGGSAIVSLITIGLCLMY